MNKHGEGHASGSLLIETNLDLDGANVVFGRAEMVQKSGHDLVLPAAFEHETFWLSSVAVGYLRNVALPARLVGGLGLRVAAGLIPAALEPYYGTRTLLGGMVYLRLAVAPPAPGSSGHPH